MTLDKLSQITEVGIKSGITLRNINVEGAYVSGVITATTLNAENYTGNATGRINPSALNVTGVATFQGNVFHGDGDIAYFGDGQDLLIFHNSTDSIIRDNGTGDLNIEGGNRIKLMNPTGIETYAVFNQDGASELYFDNVKRFETTGAGVSVYGGVTATGVVTVSAGSTSAPSISPSGDSNTGIFFPSPDTVAIGEGGVEVLRIDSSGRLGIGTNNPNSRQLSVYGPGFNGTQIECRSTVGGSSGLSMYAGRNFEIQSTASNETNYPSSFLVYDRDANGYRMAIDGSGRLQIPSQPGFFAAGTTGAANQPSSGDSDMLGTLFNTTSQSGGFNTGNHYNTSTGIFTAPVAGKYYTFFNMRWETGNFVQSSYIRIHISKNNNNNLFIHQINGANEAWANYMAMSCSGIIDLAAGDTLRPKGGLNAGTAVGWWNESSWGAWLLG